MIIPTHGKVILPRLHHRRRRGSIPIKIELAAVSIEITAGHLFVSPHIQFPGSRLIGQTPSKPDRKESPTFTAFGNPFPWRSLRGSLLNWWCRFMAALLWPKPLAIESIQFALNLFCPIRKPKRTDEMRIFPHVPTHFTFYLLICAVQKAVCTCQVRGEIRNWN